jgi:glycine cleavage system H protein
MNIPSNLKYLESHEWVKDNGDGTATVGITAIAQDQLGELVYVELPKVGKALTKGTASAVVESTKAASDVYAPISGEVVAVNDVLGDAPQTVNESPYENGWLFKLKIANAGELAGLLDADTYSKANS